LPALLAAADRGVPGAWEVVGKLATPADLKPIVERAREGDLSAIRPALDAMLRRANWPLEGKLRAVQLVQGLGSGSARSCLVDWLAAETTSAQPRLRQALLQAVQRIDREHPDLKTRDVANVAPPQPEPAPAPPAGPRAAGMRAAPGSAVVGASQLALGVSRAARGDR
jgi:hypothetical protein